MKLFEINVLETFPHLTKTPIVEAALEIYARADDSWTEETVSASLRAQLHDYPSQKPRRELLDYPSQTSTRPKELAGSVAFHAAMNFRWCAIEAKSENGKQIAFFEMDRFLFSRLAPYPGWNAFREEAKRLWDIHQDLARPAELQRIGLRFINRLILPAQDLHFEDYLTTAPKEPDGLPLPFSGFLHRDLLAVPGYEYGVSITKAIQPAVETSPPSVVLIIDLDVFTTKPVPLEDANLEKCLSEMRWLKNKAFFGTVSQQAKEQFL